MACPASMPTTTRSTFPRPSPPTRAMFGWIRTSPSRQSVFARFSYKNRQVITAPSPTCTYTYCAEAGSPLQGGYNTPEIDEGLTFAHNYVFSPKLLNEFRGGFNAQHASETQSYSTAALLAQTGLTVPQPDTQWSEAPQVLINGFMSTGAGNPGMQRGQIVQALDNLTWTPRQPHLQIRRRLQAPHRPRRQRLRQLPLRLVRFRRLLRRRHDHWRSVYRISAWLSGLYRGKLHQQSNHERPRLFLRRLYPGRLEGLSQPHDKSRHAL